MTDIEMYNSHFEAGERSQPQSRPLSQAYTVHDNASLKSKEEHGSEAEEGIEEAFAPARDEEDGFHQHGGQHPGTDTSASNIVDWEGENDPENPMNWSRGRKWWITIMCSSLTFVVSFGSSVFSTATEVTAQRFGASDELMILGVTLYVLGFACGGCRFAVAIRNCY